MKRIFKLCTVLLMLGTVLAGCGTGKTDAAANKANSE